MPKINVYLPDELAAAVRAAGIPVSPICQHALAEAVRAVGVARKAIDAIRDPAFDPDRHPQLGPRLQGRMTPRLQRALTLARQARPAEPAVGTSALLVGVLDEGDNLAVRILTAMGVDVDDLRAAATTTSDEREPAMPGFASEPGPDASLWNGLTLSARSAIATALEESIAFGHNYLGCEHLLLGLVADQESAAGGLLRDHSVDPAAVRRAVANALAGFVHARQAAEATSSSTMEDIARRLDAIERRLDAQGA